MTGQDALELRQRLADPDAGRRDDQLTDQDLMWTHPPLDYGDRPTDAPVGLKVAEHHRGIGQVADVDRPV